MSQSKMQRGQTSLPNLFPLRLIHSPLFWVMAGVFILGVLFLAAGALGNRENRTSQEEGLAPAAPIQISSPEVDVVGCCKGVLFLVHHCQLSFAPRQLLAQEGVRGTPVLAAGKDNEIAIWQTSSAGETKMRELGNDGSTLSVAANAELPSASLLTENYL